ncbi:putative mfs multidrug transporter protein [Neofusicoccum parvum UCRNP2]|uniref:Putative mfs multidrug transporter protein n=1 Tax=Botryosphaeria parva (strain UCR-NP2) TaxID=1287680 RepID=R1GC09_BOTPV|nr:putative mfs multidrug transporter protein [Neofusicoccum parvum UCRNP2]
MLEMGSSSNSPSPQGALSPENDVQNAATEEQEFKPGLHFWLALAPIAVLAMMVSLDGTSVSVALPIMAEHLNGSAIEAFWTGTSFLLSSSVFQLPIGALSEIFGRMYTLSGCIVFFLVGIIISSVSHGYTEMLVGRTLQGVGGGGIILLNDIVITDLVPMRQRGAYFGIIGGIWALGSVSGPVIGGALAYKASWRWLFWINIPFAVISLIMAPVFLRLKRTSGSVTEKLRRVDWFGSALFVGATTSFLMPLTWGGVQFAWDSWRTLFPLILGVAAIAAFCIYEKYVPTEPIIQLSLLGDYNMAFSLFSAVVNAAIVYGALYFLPLYFEAVKNYNPILAGVALFPATFTVAPMSIIAGIVISKTGDYRVVTWLGWIAATIGLGVMILLDVSTSVAQWFFITFTTGIGLGLLYTSLAIINQAATPSDELMSFAVSLFIFARCLGQCLGVAMSGSIFQNRMRQNLLNTSLADKAVEYSRDASSIVAVLGQMPEGQAKDDLIQAYADSLKIVWAVFCALAGVATVASFFVKKVSLDRDHQTKQGLDGVSGGGKEVVVNLNRDNHTRSSNRDPE